MHIVLRLSAGWVLRAATARGSAGVFGVLEMSSLPLDSDAATLEGGLDPTVLAPLHSRAVTVLRLVEEEGVGMFASTVEMPVEHRHLPRTGSVASLQPPLAHEIQRMAFEDVDLHLPLAEHDLVHVHKTLLLRQAAEDTVTPASRRLVYSPTDDLSFLTILSNRCTHHRCRPSQRKTFPLSHYYPRAVAAVRGHRCQQYAIRLFTCLSQLLHSCRNVPEEV